MPNDKRERLIYGLINELRELQNRHLKDNYMSGVYAIEACISIVDKYLLKNDAELVVRCKDCDLSIDDGCREDTCWCRVHAAFLTKDFYCKYGTPRET